MEVVISKLDHLGALSLKIIRLVLAPDPTGKLGNRGLRNKVVNGVNLRYNAREVDRATTRNGNQGIRE